jgi:hypothetical protein
MVHVFMYLDGLNGEVGDLLVMPGTHPGFVDTLVDRLVNDESDLVRRNATLSLARLGPYAKGAIPELAQAMRDGNHYVRGFAVQALYRIGTPEAFKAAMDRLQTLRCDSEPKGQVKRGQPNKGDQKKIVVRQ